MAVVEAYEHGKGARFGVPGDRTLEAYTPASMVSIV
jgi:hypothetical protein